MHQWSRHIQSRLLHGPLVEGTDYEIGRRAREDARATTGALVHEMQRCLLQPGKSDWNTFETIRSFAARGENVAGPTPTPTAPMPSAPTATTEIHTFQIRHGTSETRPSSGRCFNAEFSVAIPLYSALLTEVSPLL